MKRAISLFLSLIMVVGICTAMPFARIEANAAEGFDIFAVSASEFKNDYITYTVYIKKGMSLLGSIIYAEFDSTILAINENSTGAYITTDSYGDEIYSVNGVYEQGFMSGTDNRYSVAHVYGTESDFKAGSSDKPYIQFTFKVIDGNRPKTTVKFYCYELKSRNNPENDIPNGSSSLIFSDTRTTLGQAIISSVETDKDGVRVKWDKLTGADSYILYKNNVIIYETSDNNVTEYLDTQVENNTTYSYTVRAVNEASGDEYQAPLSDAVSIKYLAAPSEISLSSVCGNVVVEWQAVEGATAYQVCRRTVNADGSVSDWVSFDKVSDTKYSDETVINGTKYEYAVRAYSDGGNSVLSVEKAIAYLVAEHLYGDWEVTQEPTCTVKGIKAKTCSNCGYIITEEIETIEHTYSTEWTIDVEPTCVAAGSKSYHCINCDSKKNVTKVPATGHKASDWLTDQEPTCEEEGLKYKECSSCGIFLEMKEVAKIEHTASGWITDKSSTCVKKGSKHKECTVCEEILETAEISMKKHTAGSWKTEKKATVTSAGKKVKKCTECGKTVETATIKQLTCSKPKLNKIENTADGVKITWGKVSGADKYYVYRKTSGGSYSRIGSTTKTYYTDKTAKSGKKYYYIVKAINEAGSSSSSSSLSKLYLSDTTLSTPKSTKGGITLKWSKVTGAEGYMVYRKTGSGSYSKIATVKGNSKVTYTDKKASKGKTYTYKIKAYKSKTYSAYSNAKKIKDKY